MAARAAAAVAFVRRLRRWLLWVTHELELRVDLHVDRDLLPRPFVSRVNEGPDWHYLAIGLKGGQWGDSIVSVEINFEETGR